MNVTVELEHEFIDQGGKKTPSFKYAHSLVGKQRISLEMKNVLNVFKVICFKQVAPELDTQLKSTTEMFFFFTTKHKGISLINNQVL